MRPDRQMRADDYHARADAADASAQLCRLPQVRAQHETAASTWRAMAQAEEQSLLQSDARRRRLDAERAGRIVAVGRPGPPSPPPSA